MKTRRSNDLEGEDLLLWDTTKRGIHAWRWVITGVLAFVLLVVGIATVHGQDLTTPQGVKDFVAGKGLPWAEDWIADVYLAKPNLTMPMLYGVATDRDYGVTPAGPLTITISDKLKYSADFGPWSFKGTVPALDWWRVAEVGAAGFGLGVLATIVLSVVFHVQY